MNTTKVKIAIIGATGLVGQEILNIIEEDFFQTDHISLFASKNSIGREFSFKDRVIKCKDIDNVNYDEIDIAFFALNSEDAKRYVPKFAKENIIVIDNSSYYRMDPDVPLIVPEVNGDALLDMKKNIIANPNCTTAQLTVALKPLHDEYKINRVVCTSMQSVSGAGKEASDELFRQTKSIYMVDKLKPKIFSKQIAFNVIPQIGEIHSDGYSQEEWKMLVETKKIIDKKIKLTATCVRVPVFVGHSIAVNIECENEINRDEAVKILRKSPGLLVIDRNEDDSFITPVEIVGEYATYVSRIRNDPSVDNGLSFWVVADNLRKGAALNAVQIAKLLCDRDLLLKK